MIRSMLGARLARMTLLLVTMLATLALLAPVADAGGPPQAHKPPIKVMTRNMYFGADLTRSIVAPTIPDFLAANAQIWTNVVQSDIDARARSIAREIVRTRPDIIGLQEVSQWLSGPFNDPADATTLEYDQLASLLKWLSFYGAPHRVIKSQTQIAIEAPAGAPYFKDFRLVDRDVIIAPKRARHGVMLSNPAGANFATNLTIPNGIGQSIAVLRGWVSVEAKANGRSFRFVNTHLESFHPLVRAAQAAELVAATGPVGSAPGDAVLVGDLNTDPLDAPPDNFAFGILLAAGLADTWTAVNPGDPGETYGFSELLNDPSPAGLFNQRIDHVMTKGSVAANAARLVGLNPANRTSGGLWPSDHAGVVTTLTP